MNKLNKLKEITPKEFKALRKKQYFKQRRICPILKRKIPYSEAVFDHKHKSRKEKLGEEGKGLLRGVLQFQANSWEGKVANAFKRYGLHKQGISLEDAVRNLANYLVNPPMKPEYIHPSERPKPRKIGKREYNKIKKFYFQIYPNRRKLPKAVLRLELALKEKKSGKTRLTKELEKIFGNNKFKILFCKEGGEK